MNIAHYALILVMFAGGICPTANAQASLSYEKEINFQHTRLQSEINAIRAAISQKGGIDLREANRKIQFEIGGNGVVNAWATRNTIFVTPEYWLQILYLADSATVVSKFPEMSLCDQAFGKAVFETLSAAQFRLISGQPALRPLAPEAFFESSGRCQKYKAYFPIDSAMRNLRDFNARTVLYITYLHELGHIVLGHKGLPAVLPAGTAFDDAIRLLARSRQEETEADDWATEQIISIFPRPMDSLSALLPHYYVSFAGLICIGEKYSTHPTGFERFSRHVRRVRDVAVARGQLKERSEGYELVESAIRLAADMNRELNCR